MLKVVIDPGHGGTDPGAVGPHGVQEKDITLAIALLVADILSPAVEVKLTRTDDTVPGDEQNELAVRAQIANDWGADCFVSIHCNSAAVPQAHGTETYFYIGSSSGKKLAAAIQQGLLGALGLTDRGVKEANFAVLRRNTCPAALVELAFISNSTEEGYLNMPGFQTDAAIAVAKGIVDFLGQAIVPEDSVRIRVAGRVLRGLIIDDLTYGPVRALAEALGKEVKWDGSTKTVTII